VALALLAACGPRYARTVVHDRDDLKVLLRARVVRGGAEPRGFSHPVTISGPRLAHILSRIDVRLGEGEGPDGGDRKPAIATDLLYPLGELLSSALAQADPSQEVVVQAVRKERSLGIFTNSYYTSFVAWVKGDDLMLSLSNLDDLVAKGEEDELREPVAGREVMAFKVLPAEGVVPAGHQIVSVDWRNPVFRSPTNVRVGPGGTVVRRTILMESPEAAGEAPEALPGDRGIPADPEILRALADLEEARRQGAVTELEYQERRRDLLRSAQEP
jgi:hypothetical protein